MSKDQEQEQSIERARTFMRANGRFALPTPDDPIDNNDIIAIAYFAEESFQEGLIPQFKPVPTIYIAQVVVEKHRYHWVPGNGTGYNHYMTILSHSDKKDEWYLLPQLGGGDLRYQKPLSLRNQEGKSSRDPAATEARLQELEDEDLMFKLIERNGSIHEGMANELMGGENDIEERLQKSWEVQKERAGITLNEKSTKKSAYWGPGKAASFVAGIFFH